MYKHLLTGVSFMLPMVVAGGLLIALAYMFGLEAYKEPGTLAAALRQIGEDAAFKLMVPLLAGYIAYSIADRPGLAPGMIGGLLASSLGAGFIGGIVAGFVAGYAAKAISHWVRLPSSLESLKPILIIPLLASLFTGLVMIYVVGKPVAGMLEGLTHFLDSMGTANAVLQAIQQHSLPDSRDAQLLQLHQQGHWALAEVSFKTLNPSILFLRQSEGIWQIQDSAVWSGSTAPWHAANFVRRYLRQQAPAIWAQLHETWPEPLLDCFEIDLVRYGQGPGGLGPVDLSVKDRP